MIIAMKLMDKNKRTTYFFESFNNPEQAIKFLQDKFGISNNGNEKEMNQK